MSGKIREMPFARVSQALVNWVRTDFMRLSVRRLALTLPFLALYSMWSEPLAEAYYAGKAVPPAFRNMDMVSARKNTELYVDAHKPGADTVLFLGDCVSYGHGASRPFTSYMSLPGRRLVNLSMQSYNHNLMLLTLEHAYQRGIRDVVIQLHPFQDYVNDVRFFRDAIDAEFGAGTVDATTITHDDAIALAEKEWRLFATAWDNSQKKLSPFDPISVTPSLRYSSLLRYDVLSRLALYRHRYLLDDGWGGRYSFFAQMNRRVDSFRSPLQEKRQLEIIEDQERRGLWKWFKVEDEAAFASDMRKYSPVTRLARYGRDHGMRIIFFMAPTFVDKIAAHTSITRRDMEVTSSVFRSIASEYGAAYLDYLDHPTLLNYMYHYDNLTVEGQKMLGQVLESDLGPLLEAEEDKKP